MRFVAKLFILLLFFGCGEKHSEEKYALDDNEYATESMEVYEVPSRSSAINNNQKIIKTSVLKFETQNLEKTYSNIARYVKQNEGFIQSDNSNKGYNKISRTLQIRIPSVNFQTTLDSITNKVAYFDTKQITCKDVSEEFIDLEARLKAKKTLEVRYLQLLSKAKNVKEMLEIEKELSNIREEIESKQGRLKYLENKVALSTFNIDFYKLNVATTVSRSYGSKMWNAVKSGFNGLSLFFLGLLNIWPLVLIISMGAFLLKKWFNKRKRK